MDRIEVRKIPVNQTIREAMTLSSLVEKSFIYSYKIDLPKELEIIGNRVVFQELLFCLINQAKKAYSNNFPNKIILLTSKLESEKELSLSVTDGGNGLSFFSKKAIQQSVLTLGDGSKESDIQKINKKIKKDFGGYLKLFSKKNRGTTIKCFFPLNQ